jgi:hypothetical protein
LLLWQVYGSSFKELKALPSRWLAFKRLGLFW